MRGSNMEERLAELNGILDATSYGYNTKGKDGRRFVNSLGKIIKAAASSGLSPERLEAFEANIPGSYIGDGYSGIDDLKPMFEAELERNNAYKNTGANLHLS